MACRGSINSSTYPSGLVLGVGGTYRNRREAAHDEAQVARNSEKDAAAFGAHPASTAAVFGGDFLGERLLGLADLSPVLPAKSAFLSMVLRCLPCRPLCAGCRSPLSLMNSLTLLLLCDEDQPRSLLCARGCRRLM